MDDILRDFLELDVPESMCDETKLFIYNWLKEKFASTNRAITPPEERDCDTCKHDGQCYVTMLKCKGYSPQ